MATGSVNGEQWSSRWGFILAAIGFSVGLGNIWRFPYVAGENGGSAFVLVYLACAFVISMPLLVSELAIGRLGRGSPSSSYSALARRMGRSPRWQLVGVLAVVCVLVVMSYYTVLSGWTFDYFVRAAWGEFRGIDASASEAMFGGLLADPWRLLAWHTVVNVVIVAIVSRGVQHGIERAATVLIPALLIALVGMMFYGMFTADFLGAVRFMLEPDFSKLTLKTVMIANGQAFFSIGIGLAAMVTFGAYLPDDVSIPRSAAIIILADTGVAVLAGLVIFPLVFAYGLSPSGGPGLVFQTLPLAFGQMPGGLVFGSLFFLLLIFAALSSCVGGIEAIVSWVERHRDISRARSVVYVAGTVWFIGLLTILSFGPLADLRPLGFIPAFADKSIFDALDFLAANILLLVGGTLTALFFGWLAPRALALEALGIEDGPLFRVLRFALRYVVPPVLVLSLLAGLA